MEPVGDTPECTNLLLDVAIRFLCILDPGKDQDTQGISKFHVNPLRIVQSSQYPQIALAKRLLGPQTSPPLTFFLPIPMDRLCDWAQFESWI